MFARRFPYPVLSREFYYLWFFVNFTVNFSSRRRQIQFSAMKQNSCFVVDEVAKPTGVGLDELDGAIETFSTGITDSVLTEVEQSQKWPHKSEQRVKWKLRA